MRNLSAIETANVSGSGSTENVCFTVDGLIYCGTAHWDNYGNYFVHEDFKLVHFFNLANGEIGFWW